MGDSPTIHIRATDGRGLSISRRGATWLARLDETTGFFQTSGVPVTVSGLKQALQGISASFVGLTNGLAFRWQGDDLRAEFVPIEGPVTLMVVDRSSLSRAIEQMESPGA